MAVTSLASVLAAWLVEFTSSLTVFAVLLYAALPPAARGWGCKGHQAVAWIAENHLSAEARQMAEKILAENPIDPQLRHFCGNTTADPLVDAATWADDVRNERHSGPWHYIDIPRGKHQGSLEEYCGSEGCVARAIEEQRAILKDRSADPRKRAEALRYLVHFVGDLHQPLHTINNGDNGGNCAAVKYLHHEPLENRQHPEREEYSPNLHQIWDTEIVERDMEISNPRRYANELDEKFRADGSSEPDVKPKSCADNNHIGKRMLEKHLTADEAYQSRAAKAVEIGIAQAGVRLAMILNDAAQGNP